MRAPAMRSAKLQARDFDFGEFGHDEGECGSQRHREALDYYGSMNARFADPPRGGRARALLAGSLAQPALRSTTQPSAIDPARLTTARHRRTTRQPALGTRPSCSTRCCWASSTRAPASRPPAMRWCWMPRARPTTPRCTSARSKLRFQARSGDAALQAARAWKQALPAVARSQSLRAADPDRAEPHRRKRRSRCKAEIALADAQASAPP